MVLLKAEMLWKMLYHLKIHCAWCHVGLSVNTVSSEQELHPLGVAHSYLHQQASHCGHAHSTGITGRLQPSANLYSQGMHSPASSRGCLFVQGWLGRRGMLASCGGSSASSAPGVQRQPGEDPGTSIRRPCWGSSLHHVAPEGL